MSLEPVFKYSIKNQVFVSCYLPTKISINFLGHIRLTTWCETKLFKNCWKTQPWKEKKIMWKLIWTQKPFLQKISKRRFQTGPRKRRNLFWHPRNEIWCEATLQDSNLLVMINDKCFKPRKSQGEMVISNYPLKG